MQESTVKFLLILIALLSLAGGALLLLLPGWYVTFADGEMVNVAWLRATGAVLVSLQGIGLVVTAVRRRDTNALLGFIAFVSTVQTGVLWFSLIAEEHSAQAVWTIVVPGILATAGVIILWMAWVSRRVSRKALGGAERPAVHERPPVHEPSAVHEPAPQPPTPREPAEDHESPRVPPHEFD
jgi:hypothetical protein